MSRERRPDLDAEIPDRHELQLDLLADGLVCSGLLGEPSGGFGLEFALAEIADIGADHESIDVLGVDALSAAGAGLQQEAQHAYPQNDFAGMLIPVPKAAGVETKVRSRP